LVFVIALPMLATSGLLRNVDVIFPEAAALTFGVLALRLPAWTRSPLRLALLPAVCATVGVTITKLGPPRWAGELLALSLAFVILHAARSRLTPSISAAIFPLVFAVDTWVFPLTVLLISVALASAVSLQRRHAYTPPSGPDRLPVASAVAAWAIAAGWIAVAGPVLGLGASAVAPPLIVAMLEWMIGADRAEATGLRHWSVLVAAAAVGVLAARNIDPTWVGGLVAVAVVLVLFAAFSGPHPPALAICLIPQVARESTIRPAHFVTALAVGAAVLYLGANIFHRWGFLRLQQGQARARTL
jgi:hypothetical protein